MMDSFDEIVAGLEPDEPPDREIVDVSELNPLELNKLYNKCRQDLLSRGELLNPRTDEGRRLHSLRSACAIVLRMQGLI